MSGDNSDQILRQRAKEGALASGIGEGQELVGHESETEKSSSIQPCNSSIRGEVESSGMTTAMGKSGTQVIDRGSEHGTAKSRTHTSTAIANKSPTSKRKKPCSPPLLVVVLFFAAIIAIVGLTALAFPSRASPAKDERRQWELPTPEPSGKSWMVAHARSSLVESSRKDPYNNSQDRKVAFSIFMPVYGKNCTATTDDEYASDLTAKACNLQFFGDKDAGVFDKLYFKSCTGDTSETVGHDHPLIIFEPAFGTSRFLYNQLSRQLSANGAYVVTIDHPYDAPLVEFVDSGAIESNGAIKLDAFKVNKPVDETETKKAIQARIDDINSVIKELEKPDTLRNYFPGINSTKNKKVNTNRLYLIGHGLGGSVASSMSVNDKRVEWIINLSGSTPVLTEDITTYTIFFGRDTYRSEDDEAWKATKKHLAGPQVEWTYSKADQFDYSDLPLVSQIAGMNKDAKGIGKPYEDIDPNDPTATFRGLSCFLEGYLRDTVLGNGHPALPSCVGWFGDSMKMHVPRD